MNDQLLARDELGFEEWSVTPDPEALVPDSIARERERASFRAQLGANPGTVVISHTDADGLSSAALLSATGRRDPVVQTVGYQDAYRFEHVLEDLTDDTLAFDPDGAILSIADFSPDGPACADALGELVAAGCHVEWFDHHQWDEVVRAEVIQAGVDLHVDTDECAASLIARETDDDWSEQTQELVAVTKDRDLWINDDPRSPKLNTFARIADPNEYVQTVLEHGVGFPDEVERRIEERTQQDERLEQAAVERAESHQVGEEFYAAVTYTAGGNTSNIGNELVEDHDPLFDIAVVCTPSSVSFYAHSEDGTFDHCHEVAAKLGGGGHPTAAGAGVPAENFRELAQYWGYAGQDVFVETRLLSAVAEVVL
jgi:oligoribonuclease NrnB/cAMP/cGMP phosphodiesterase (DHH superfamily)